jgi:hypothetical protein
MHDSARKLAAAIAAVSAYLQIEAEQAAAAEPGPAAAPAAAGPMPWSLAGRQGQMQLRGLMQLRAFNRRA